MGALGWRFARMRSASADRRAVEAWVSGLYGVGLLALGLYFVQSDVGTGLFGGPLSQKAPRLAVSLAALFPALLACCLLPLAMVEVAAAAMTRAPVLETGRVRSALYSGLGLAFVLVFAFASMFVATQADVTWDLSYFRTAKPGDGTRKVIRGLNEPLQVTLFFPPANEVGEAVGQYFRDLSVESPGLLTWCGWTRRWSRLGRGRWASTTTAPSSWRAATGRSRSRWAWKSSGRAASSSGWTRRSNAAC